MFERYLIDVLTAKFGQYISNLNDKDTINLSAWKGEISLSDLRLNPDAISSKLFGDDANPPVQILYGNIGQFELLIPWKSLRRKLLWGTTPTNSSSRSSSPTSNFSNDNKNRFGAASNDAEIPAITDDFCSVVLSDVHILLSCPAKNSSEYLSSIRREAKEREVQRLLGILLRQTLFQGEEEEEESKSEQARPKYWKWIKQFSSFILSTLKVTIRNVHIRYEDQGVRKMGQAESSMGALKQNSFAIGMTLHKFILESIDRPPINTFTNENTSINEDMDKDAQSKNKSHKIIGLEKLSVYWDSDSTYDLMSLAWAQHEEEQEKDKEATEKRPRRRNKRDRHRSKHNVNSTSTKNDQIDLLKVTEISAIVASATKTHRRHLKDRAPIRDNIHLFRNREEFFKNVFQNLLIIGEDKVHDGQNNSSHSYLLRPISPTLYLSLADIVSKSNDEDIHKENLASSKIKVSPQPILEAQATVPSCKFLFSKAILDDLAYLRKSVAFSSLSEDDDISDDHIQQLSTLRPMERPNKAPRLWWKYAFRAIRTVLEQSTSHRRRDRIGWLGLVRVLKLRKDYIELYHVWQRDPDREKMLELQKLEDSLETQEIAAFRAYVHVKIDKFNEDVGPTPKSNKLMQSSLEYYEQEAKLLSEIAAASERAKKISDESIELIKGQSEKWTVKIAFMSFSLELSDDVCPIVLFSCSAKQYFSMNYDGSWTVNFVTANLEILDLMSDDHSKILCGKNMYHESNSVDLVQFEETSLPHSGSFCVKNDQSQTYVGVRLSPLQVVYSTLPFYSLHLLLSDATTPEFSSDYERLRMTLLKWRVRQSQNLRKALENRRRIVTEIDVAAPIVLVPEGNQMLILDLGKLTFRNSPGLNSQEEDSWNLNLSNVQALYTQSQKQVFLNELSLDNTHALVEPFSIEFLIVTNFTQKETSLVYVNAILPRLVFNITTSATRLIHILQKKWNERERKKRKLASRTIKSRLETNMPSSKDQNDANQQKSSSIFKFNFSAPYIALHIENDVDGRDCGDRISSTKLLQITLQKIRGTFIRDLKSTFSIRLGALRALDLYQKAGRNFESLLSSALTQDKTVDLVQVEYTKYSNAKEGSRLSVVFNDLFVEWNPETVAATQKALRSPSKNNPYISRKIDPRIANPSISDEETINVAVSKREKVVDSEESNNLSDFQYPPFELIFSLPKLHINFNKESRCRRLVSAQMTNTDIQYKTKAYGGIQIKASIGNLTFKDNGTAGGTLYTQFVGLKLMKKQRSLVYLEYESFPRATSSNNEHCASLLSNVKINENDGIISGYDSSLSLKFSPMRFVFLKELWMEIFDYLFEGILGYEVWGLDRPPADPPINEIKNRLDMKASNALKFLMFTIDMDSPTIVLPVAYRSPQHIRLEVEHLNVSNRFSGESKKNPFHISMQWFNNCAVSITGLNFLSWRDRSLSATNISLQINIKWPIGLTAPLIVPKWNANFTFSEMNISIYRQDYILFMHVLYNNIMEETRNLEEWKIQKQHRTNEMVNYGYDFKDHPPTSYLIVFHIDGISVDLLDSDTSIGSIRSRRLQYSLQKGSDHILNQKLVCGSVILSHSTGNNLRDELTQVLLPLKESTDPDDTDEMIVYKSSTKPNSDHFKSLEINNACIFCVYSAWISLQNFFAQIPSPEFFSVDKVQNLIQIGDRWYPIKDSYSSKLESNAENSMRFVSDHTKILNDKKSTPTHQVRLLLTSPRIVLVAENCSSEENRKGLTLMLSHFEYFYNIDRNAIQTSEIFIHALELFTNLAKNPRKSSDHDSSLIHPMNAAVTIQLENEKKSIKFLSETIRARAAFTDMSLAIDVFTNLLNDISTSGKPYGETSKPIESLDREGLEKQSGSDGRINKNNPVNEIQVIATCDGVRLCVVDNSLRHFAGTQDLVEISLDTLEYRLKKNSRVEEGSFCETFVRLKSVTVIDCLQPPESMYRIVVRSQRFSRVKNKNSNAGQYHKETVTILWGDFCSRLNKSWGYESSPSMNTLSNEVQEKEVLSNNDVHQLDLIEIFHFETEILNRIKLRCRALSVQWNPSTIIALKRFFDGLVKVTYSKPQLFGKKDGSKPDKVKENSRKENHNSKELNLSLYVEELNVCLNKEHQSRRLLEIKLSETEAFFGKDMMNQLHVHGKVGDILAIDPSLSSGNKFFIEVVREGSFNEKLFTFHYQTFLGGSIPDTNGNWVAIKAGEVDDYLSLKLLAIKIVYINDRTAELIDYLSNGLPAAGIGATTRAAKGFLECRIKTRSAMQILVKAPIIVMPRHNHTDACVSLEVGDIDLKSWFEESSELDLESKMTEELSAEKESTCKMSPSPNEKDWWRCLSINITGLGRNLFVSKKANLHLILRKPSWFSKTVIVRGRLTRIEAVIAYENWALFRAVLMDNLLKVVDESSWDNVDRKASEEDANNENEKVFKASFSPVKKYVQGAHVIHYGKKNSFNDDYNVNGSINDNIVKPVLEFDFDLEGMSIILHRNDPLPSTVLNKVGKLPEMNSNSIVKGIDYDLAKLSVQKMTIGISSYASGDNSAYLKLYGVNLYDLGDYGRNFRESISNEGYEPSQRKSCAFSVLFEGYNSTEKDQDTVDSPQLVLSFDLSPRSSPVARVVVDYLSMNVLVRPLLEIFEFLSCAWPLQTIADSAKPRGLMPEPKRSNNSTPITKLNSRENFFWKTVNEESDEFLNEDDGSGFQVKLVAHYPRIFLLADESDASTRALVLRGLAVMNFTLMKERVTIRTEIKDNDDSRWSDWNDYRTITSFDAHFNSMETYINPNLGESKNFSNITNESHNELGIALIEPVTSTLEFTQVQRNLHPTRRSFNVGINPVSTMLSFEDLCLIEAVLSRMSKDGNRAVKDRHQRDEIDSTKLSVSKHGKEIENQVNKSVFDAPSKKSMYAEISSYMESIEYNVTFTSPKLGLVLRKSGDGFKVDKMLIHKQNERIKIGDTLITIDGMMISRLSFSEVRNLLETKPRPLHLTFRETIEKILPINEPVLKTESLALDLKQHKMPNMETSHEPSLFNVFHVTFSVGVACGIAFARSHIGDIATVATLDENEFLLSTATISNNFSADVLENHSSASKAKLNFSETVVIPHPGAVILEINDVPTSSLGYRKTMDLLGLFSSLSEEEKEEGRHVKSTYTITFLEAHSLAWACFDKVEITMAGLKLTVIDDIHGRDMPLVRGSLTDFDIYVRSGLGLKTYSIAVLPPSILNATKSVRNNLITNPSTDLSELIIKFKSEAQVGLEYYNARIAVWEPLVEPCWLQIQVEWQRGNAELLQQRPGQLSILIADKSMKNDKRYWFYQEEQKNISSPRNRKSVKPTYVLINLTDAALEMIIKTANELSEWMKGGIGDDAAETANAVITNWNESSFGSPSKTHENLQFLQDFSDHPSISEKMKSNTDLESFSSNIDIFENRTLDEKNVDHSMMTKSSQNVAIPFIMSSPTKSLPSKQLSNSDGAKKAAQAALLFAKKRGAQTQKKGNWAKPFVLRNKTGVSIAFVQQTQNKGENNMNKANVPHETLKSREKYKILFTGYDLSSVQEISNESEALFNMDLLYDKKISSSSVVDSSSSEIKSSGGKRVRSYEGQFPYLSVALDPSLGTKHILKDLPVVKVGQTVRRLFTECNDTQESRNSKRKLIMVWTVELENNRRILTLSSAVSVSSQGCGSPIEIGYDSKCWQNHNHVTMKHNSSNGIVPLGIAKPHFPYYLPLWLCVDRQITIYIRPKGMMKGNKYFENAKSSKTLDHDKHSVENFFSWSKEGILEFSCDTNESKSSIEREWKWKQIASKTDPIKLSTVKCYPINASEYMKPVFFACTGILDGQRKLVHPVVEEHNEKKKKIRFKEETIVFDDVDKMLSISIGSCFTLRNLLPIPIEWEVAILSELDEEESNTIETLDGSYIRNLQYIQYGGIPLAAPETRATQKYLAHEDFRSSASANTILSPGSLESGEGAEIFPCNMSNMTIHARFRCQEKNCSWTDWVIMSFYSEEHGSPHDAPNNIDEPSIPVDGHQFTVQAQSKDGAPLTFGLKMMPKILSSSPYASICRSDIYGIDVILYADLWMRNLSHLNLTFGAPDVQLFGMNLNSFGNNDDAAAAKATLMEIASVLELGEKGKPLRSNEKFQSLYIGGEIFNLPRQNQSKEIHEEVFEYIEVESSTVKQRWWATELHNKSRLPPFHHSLVGDTKYLGWKVDVSGQLLPEAEGWESCNILDDFNEVTLLGKRVFQPYHRYRRRRWFRKTHTNFASSGFETKVDNETFFNITSAEEVMFHHPIKHNPGVYTADNDQSVTSFIGHKFSDLHGIEQKDSINSLDFSKVDPNDLPIRICVRCQDGRWGVPITVPTSGNGHGVIRLYASRWRLLVENEQENSGGLSKSKKEESSSLFLKGCVSPGAFDLSYHVSVLQGAWGEVSRLLTISSRYMIRNDSKLYHIDIKQIGAPEDTVLRIHSGEIKPFYWTDIRLPELVCVRPILILPLNMESSQDNEEMRIYNWSGGFDLSALGMLSLRIRKKYSNLNESDEHKWTLSKLRTLRAHVEIRPGTDGTGITLSLKEENYSGEGSLFRIENFSPFPLWIAQDGVLSNPATSLPKERSDREPSSNAGTIHEDVTAKKINERNDEQKRNGEIVEPSDSLAFGLDVPFRQGKYAHRRVASMAELLMLRISLAPLSTRDGIELTQVISLTAVGKTIRLNPSKLNATLNEHILTELLKVRVLGIVCADGPTRVLRFCLIQREVTASGAIGSVVRRHAKQSEAYFEKITASKAKNHFRSRSPSDVEKTRRNCVLKSIELLKNDRILGENEAKICALKGEGIFKHDMKDLFGANECADDENVEESDVNDSKSDTSFKLKLSFHGFAVSIVDTVPSEIAVISLRSVVVMAKWNSLRSKDASLSTSIGWMQIDNHCPNAPYKVALCPIEKNMHHDENKVQSQQPFLLAGITFAPRHTSGIPCLKSVTIAPRDVAISLDLAFIMRMQKFFLNIQDHLSLSKDAANYVGILSKDDQAHSELNPIWAFPDLRKIFKDRENDATEGRSDQKLYFEGLTIYPCYVTLSVAQARSLTKAQAVLEGNEAAAVHAAVRKGDLLLGDGAGVLGVKISSKNATALAVIRGVLKSLLVDVLLRTDAASLNFPGVAIRNHISSSPQLTTYLSAHYLAALRRNVPALIGSLSAFGNPIGLIRGLGDGVSDFVSEPIRGLKKSVEELDPTLFVDGVAKGTGSLARHAVGGFADTASLLTDTLSKNMAVLTLDRKYVQRRDRGQTERNPDGTKTTFVDGVGSGSVKLVKGILDGVTGVVRAPIRGAEKKGMEGFAKGVGKGLLGLVVKPVIGISDAATDVMIGVKGSIEGDNMDMNRNISQIRPRRAFYGRERELRVYNYEDASAAGLMIKTRLAGDSYMDHCFIGNKIVLIGAKKFILLGEDGVDRMMIGFKQIEHLEVQNVPTREGNFEWGVLIFMIKPKKSRSRVEAINCGDKIVADKLFQKLHRCLSLTEMEGLYR